MINLNGQWRLRQLGTDDWIPAQVPGCVHTDLLSAGRIPDPLAEMNELDLLWIDEADWEFERTFDVDTDFLGRRGQWLVCDGLDTLAEIAINDQTVARTDNMFRRYRMDVAAYLQPGTNRIHILFRSPVHYGRRQSEKNPPELPGTEYTWGTGRTRKVYRPYVRKAQYQFGWDWGPCLPTSGIWRDIHLTASDGPQIEYVTTSQQHQSGEVRVAVSAHLLAPVAGGGQLEIAIGSARNVVHADLAEGQQVVDADITIESPRLWWPRGLGEPYLYPLTVRWQDESGRAQSCTGTHIGLRSTELVRTPDADGESFLLRINETDVFCKGANWIPADPFPTRVSPQRYQKLIRSAVDANMNTLRVWGGGVYEDDVFYDLCDRHGILIWQDFMFACGAYPADDGFLESVAAEVRHQIRRLNNHPSIVLWCGDNEDEWAVTDWWSKDRRDPPLRHEYDRLIADTVAPIVAREDPTRPWWPSSPSSGGSGKPNDSTRGDTHFWDVWHGGEPFERYLDVAPRFCSEFGFQSFPTVATLKTAIEEPVADLAAPVMQHHQRHLRGNRIIEKMIGRLFRKPAHLDDFVYLSQITQGLALQTAVEHWRRCKPHCMGVLYWQLNDCWVAASWASIDYELRYKAAHFFAKRFFAELLGSVVRDRESDTVHVWATSDSPEALEGTCIVESWTLDGRALERLERPFSLAPQENRCIADIPLGNLFTQTAPLRSRLLRVTLSADDRRHETHHVFAPYKQLHLPTATIDTDIVESDGDLEVVLNTDAPALFVALDSGEISGVFGDNYMTLLPGSPARVSFAPTDRCTAAQLRRNLQLRSLAGQMGRS